MDRGILDRKARCCLKGQYGPVFGTSVGLPQGSVISSVLFSIYLQDIFQEITSKGVKYADDGTIWVTRKGVNALTKDIEEDLRKIYSWTIVEDENKHWENKFVSSLNYRTLLMEASQKLLSSKGKSNIIIPQSYLELFWMNHWTSKLTFLKLNRKPVKQLVHCDKSNMLKTLTQRKFYNCIKL